MDVCYLHKKTGFDTIRYSLRSLKHMDHGKVWVVGDKCDWMVNVHHMPIPDDSDDWSNTTLKMYEISINEEISEHCIIMYDDVFLLKEYKPVIYYNHPLSKKATVSRGIRGDNFRQTYRYLGDGSMNCDLHYPLPINRREFRDIMDAFVWRRGVQPFSLYGNLQTTFPVRCMEDCKVTGQSLQLKRRDFLSTRQHHECEENREIFENLFKTKSKYEL